jgi:hypothetical protein
VTYPRVVCVSAPQAEGVRRVYARETMLALRGGCTAPPPDCESFPGWAMLQEAGKAGSGGGGRGGRGGGKKASGQ